jgi:hypothetical protein
VVLIPISWATDHTDEMGLKVAPRGGKAAKNRDWVYEAAIVAPGARDAPQTRSVLLVSLKQRVDERSNGRTTQDQEEPKQQ